MQGLCIPRKQLLGILLSHFRVILLRDVGLDVGWQPDSGPSWSSLRVLCGRGGTRVWELSAARGAEAAPRRGGGGARRVRSPVGYLAVRTQLHVLPCLCRGREWKGSDALFSI